MVVFSFSEALKIFFFSPTGVISPGQCLCGVFLAHLSDFYLDKTSSFQTFTSDSRVHGNTQRSHTPAISLILSGSFW